MVSLIRVRETALIHLSIGNASLRFYFERVLFDYILPICVFHRLRYQIKRLVTITNSTASGRTCKRAYTDPCASFSIYSAFSKRAACQQDAGFTTAIH